MTFSTPKGSQVIKSHTSHAMALRALRVQHRGRERLLLEVDTANLQGLLADDDDRPLYRCSEFENEPELMRAFDRAVAVMG